MLLGMLACLTKVSDALHSLDSVQQTILINWNKEMKDIIKVVKCLEKSDLLLGNVSKMKQRKTIGWIT